MAYRRKQGVSRGATFDDEIVSPSPSPRVYQPPAPTLSDDNSSSLSSSSLAAKAIRASSAYRDSSLSSAYGQSAIPAQDSNPLRSSSSSSTKDSNRHKYTSMKSLDETKPGFWGALARKAKAIIEDDNVGQHRESPGRSGQQMSDTSPRAQYYDPYQSRESSQKSDNPALQKGLGAIASSINYIGGTIGNALEEGISIVENRTADIIQETKKLQLRKKGGISEARSQASSVYNTRQQPHNQQPQMEETALDIQLKASRDVAMAMAAKAKLLLRELKTVKADLAFAKERCAQLEEENRVLRENRAKGNNLEDDDMIRLQLETLLAEKARLAQENSVYARENRFLREVVEYHQLTMQDVVYLNEGSEEVTEVYSPVKVPSVSGSSPQSISTTPSRTPLSISSPTTSLWRGHNSEPVSPLSSFIHIPVEEHPE